MGGARPLHAGASRAAGAHRRPALSPFERDYASLEDMASAWRAMMNAGTLDRLDGEHLITIVVRWHTDQV